MEVIGSKGGRGQVAALNCQRQCGYGYCNGRWTQNSNQNSLTHKDLWHWLVDNRVSRSQIDRKPTKFLLDLCKQKSSRSSEQKSKSQSQKQSHDSSINAQT